MDENVRGLLLPSKTWENDKPITKVSVTVTAVLKLPRGRHTCNHLAMSPTRLAQLHVLPQKPKGTHRNFGVQLVWQTPPEYGGLSWSVFDISSVIQNRFPLSL